MRVFIINDNVIKYTFGKPINTDAVVIKGYEIDKRGFSIFNIKTYPENESTTLIYNMGADDIVLGLGQNLGGINKRGRVIESYCTDDPIHTPDKKSLYGAHNFLVIDGKHRFGAFIDTPGKVKFDIGFSNRNILEICILDRNFDFYFIDGSTSREIVENFLNIIGDSYAPPKWAFGFQQSRWGYKDRYEIESIAENFLKHDIPCDAIYLDIDYMDRYKNFTINDDAFFDFENFVSGMKKKGYRLVPIIDAGVKIEEGYEIYEEGVQNNYFCIDEHGKPFVGAVWPGKVHFPDFLNSKVRKWFGSKYKRLTDMGIEGFWNDMNEPAIFYTEGKLKEAIKKARESEGKSLGIETFFDLKNVFTNLQNNPDDYKSFYHNINGELFNHDKVHNLYGYNMTRAASEGLEAIEPDKRFLLISRASYVGAHRYTGIWTGDNHSWWEHILLNIKMMPSLNMCGFLYSGADTGGFSGDADGELVIRWTQFSIFTPLLRNHSCMGTRRQEPFAFDKETIDILRKTIKLRYALIPYIYSEFMKAVINNTVYISPLIFEYDDEISRRVENQLLVGGSIMITPIYEQNSRGRYVWLPEDMLLWKAKDYQTRKYQVFRKGHRYLDVNLDEIPIFIRKNKAIALGKHAENVDSQKYDELTIIAFVENKAIYFYYDDDGVTKGYKRGEYSQIVIEIEKNEEDFRIKIDNKGNKELLKINFEIIDISGKVTKKSLELSD